MYFAWTKYATFVLQFLYLAQHKNKRLPKPDSIDTGQT